jgi:F0F1-type ATP synthase assembly protein I
LKEKVKRERKLKEKVKRERKLKEKRQSEKINKDFDAFSISLFISGPVAVCAQAAQAEPLYLSESGF